ncbi:MAG: tol-pal system-associated acyl-CoA thioesterase [Betaproteobacteria bacterium]|nr:tol-pal system-associated acyl-CoA thioesterase [Betaproteobacteria bacterium]
MAKLSLKNAQQTPLFTFDFPQRIYFEDTDAGGVVYHAQYLKFLERARTEWLRYLGFTNSELERKYKMLWVVSEIAVEFVKPAKLDDSVNISVSIENLGRVRCTFHQEIRRGDELLVRARVLVACVSADGFKPIEIPADVRKKMEATV